MKHLELAVDAVARNVDPLGEYLQDRPSAMLRFLDAAERYSRPVVAGREQAQGFDAVWSGRDRPVAPTSLGLEQARIRHAEK